MPYVKSEKSLLLTERQLVVGHRIDDGQAGQLVAGSAQLGAARLEALLNADADAADGRTCLRADIQQTLHGLAVGEEVVQNQHLVRGGEKLLGQRDVIIAAIGVGMNGGGVDLAVNVLALGLLGKDDRYVEMPRGHAGDGDAGCLDGQNLVDAVVLEDAVELLADLVQQVYVQLVVQKAVDLQDIAGTNLAFLHNTFLQKFHLR